MTNAAYSRAGTSSAGITISTDEIHHLSARSKDWRCCAQGQTPVPPLIDWRLLGAAMRIESETIELYFSHREGPKSRLLPTIFCPQKS